MSDCALLWLEPLDGTLQNASGANGNGTAINLDGKYASLTVQVVGSGWTGTLNFEATQDGANYVAIEGKNRNSGARVTTATANGLFVFDVVGVKKFRARQSGFAAGTVTTTATAVAAPPGESGTVQTQVTGSIPAGTNTIGGVTLPNVEGTPGVAIPSKNVVIAGATNTDITKTLHMASVDGEIRSNVLYVVPGGINGSGTVDAARVDAQKNLLVGLRDSSGNQPNMGAYPNADGAAAPTITLAMSGFGMGFNGTTWDRLRTALLSGGTVGGGALAMVPHVVNVSAGNFQPLYRAQNLGDGVPGDNFGGTAIMGKAGTTYDIMRVANINKAYANTLAALAVGAVWTPAAGKKFRLMFLMLSCDTSVQMLIQDAGTTLVQVKLAANTPMVLPMPANGILSGAANNALNVKNNDGAASSVIYVLTLGTEE